MPPSQRHPMYFPFAYGKLQSSIVVLGLLGYLSSVPVYADVAAASAAELNQQRERAVLMAKQGRAQEAAQRLQKLHHQAPQNQQVLADLILILRQLGDNQQITALNDRVVPTQLPAYAVMAWLGALRDCKDYSHAKSAVDQLTPFYSKHPSAQLSLHDLDIFNAVVGVESNDIPRAQSSIGRLNKVETLDADQLTRLNYAKQALADLTDPRHLAVAQARKGFLSDAIAQLQQLHQQSPDDVKVTADLILLLRQTGQLAQVNALTATLDPNRLPDYAVLPWLYALRDGGYYDRAVSVIASIEPKYQSLPVQDYKSVTSLQLMRAMLLAESGKAQPATDILKTTTDAGLSADQYARLAYVWRLLKDYPKTLKYADLALQLNEGQTLALQQKVTALSSMGAVDDAAALALSHPADFSDAEKQHYQADQQVTYLNEAIAQRRYLERQGHLEQGNEVLDQALQSMAGLINTLGKDSSSYVRLNNDYIYGLRTREKWQETIQVYQALGQPLMDQAPAHTRRAVADAYLATRQPEMSLPMYLRLLREQPKADVALYLSLYDNELALEDYQSAQDILTYLDKNTPKLRWTRQAGAEPIANWERLDVDRNLALFDAYRNHNDQAVKRFASLYAQAPMNEGLMGNYATVLRWRGLPQQSDRLIHTALQYNPDDRFLRLNAAETARDLGQYPRWGQLITQLHQDQPNDAAVRDNYHDWQSRARPSMYAEADMGQSRASQSASQVHGMQDAAQYVRVNSPWLNDYWRPYVEYRHLTQENNHLPDSKSQRVGAGVEWDKERQNAWISVSKQLDGSRLGIGLGWSQQLNDHWGYHYDYNSVAPDVPLRALDKGYSASSWSAGVNWKANETRSAAVNYKLMKIDDGNLRQDISLAGNQQIQANEHHITTAGAGVYYQHNSQPGGSYFNPQSNLGLGVNLTHDWVTWRRYDHAFTQHVEVSSGLGQQSGYATAPALDLLYQHRWKFSRDWQLSYGIGWGSHVYDGGREQRTYGMLALSGVF